MMTQPQQHDGFSAEDYLAWELQQPDKHEYVRGEVFAMTGVSDAHATVSVNFVTRLHAHLRGTPCRLFASDMKLGVAAANSFFYPDLLVTCDQRDRAAAANYVKCYPTLLVEILSKSTEAYDRGGKFAIYRLIDTLREYVLVSTDRKAVDVFRRDPTGRWVLYPFEADADLELASIDFRCPLPALFEGIES